MALLANRFLADMVDSWLPRLVVYEPDSHGSLGSYVTVLAADSGWMAPRARQVARGF